MRVFATLASALTVFLATNLWAQQSESPAVKNWSAAIEKIIADEAGAESRLQDGDEAPTPERKSQQKSCAAHLREAFQHALTSGHAADGNRDTFAISLPAKNGEQFLATYSYIGGNPLTLTISRVPSSWRLVILSARQMAGLINIYTDDSTGCVYQLDSVDPSQARGSAVP